MSEVFFGGLPTGPEVKKLETAFPAITDLRGQTLTHEQLEAVIGHKRTEPRYKTVVSAWRRKVERETGVIISGRDAIGVGYRVLLDGEQVSFGVKQRKAAGRKIRRGISALMATDTAAMSEQERAVREHELVGLGRVHAVLLEARKQIKAPSIGATS